jgi:hypothetical protein
VTAWFIKAGEYLLLSAAKIGFVATNSITQGEQVAQLWPILFERFGLEIGFAHRTFTWQSDARGTAHVHVVIIGLCRRGQEPAIKRLFSYGDLRGDPTESHHAALTAYLFDASGLANPHLVIKEVAKPINGAPKMIIGSKPIDGGYLIFDDEEKARFLQSEPVAEKFLRPFIGGIEYIQGRSRWILALQNASPTELRAMMAVMERLRAVKEYRKGERLPKKKENKAQAEVRPPGISARALADSPSEFHVTVIPKSPFLAIPENSSETREYLPLGWLEPPTIPSNKMRLIRNANLWHFAILTSRMHMAWLRYVGGRIKSDFQYSIGIVYNNFPWPNATDEQRSEIRRFAQTVLDSRAKFPNSTLADLYDVDVMPRELRKAHHDLDTAVDKLYRSQPFTGERDRVEHLFGLYEALVAPLAAAQPKPRRRRTRRVSS